MLIHQAAVKFIILFFMDFSRVFPKVLANGTTDTCERISLEFIS